MENKFDWIEKYLMNEMSVREQIEFEESLRTNPDLMKEFLLRRRINDAITEDDILNLRQNLNHIFNPQTSKLNKRIYVYSAAAAILVFVIVLSGIFLHQDKQIEKNSLFAAHYSVYPAMMSFRSLSDQNDTTKLMYEAFNYYNEREYDSAAVYFKMVLEKDATNTMSQFYLSVCEIENNNLIEAEEYLSDLIQKKNHIFWEQSNWYLALVYLKQNEFDRATSVLRKVVQENMTQKPDAEIILKNLN
jgi:tetratricopeptide (TPR) repeat protein